MENFFLGLVYSLICISCLKAGGGGGGGGGGWREGGGGGVLAPNRPRCVCPNVKDMGPFFLLK